MRFPVIHTSIEQTEQKFRRIRVCLKKTRRECLKSALYPRLEKRKFEIFFMKKLLKSKGDPLKTKNFEKTSHSAEQILETVTL